MRRLLAIVCLALLVPVSAQTTGPPMPQDVQSSLDAAASHPWARLVDVGVSAEDRPIRVIEFTDPDGAVPLAQRPVVLIMTQQHGNEPAGTPAALDVIHDITEEDAYAGALGKIVLLVMPQSNPDGSQADTRANATGTDINRDHVGLTSPEARAIHKVLELWDVHIAMDHHEYSGTGLGSPSPVRFYDYDLTIMHPRHGNVREPTLEQARRLDAFIRGQVEEDGFSVGDYGTMTAAGIPVQHLAGGPDPGILRNNYGLNNVAGLLIESFIPSRTAGEPFVTFEDRVAAHRAVMDATIAYGAQGQGEVIAAKRESERLNVEEPMEEYIEEWPDDPQTGEPNDGNRRGSLAANYSVAEDLDALMALHGLGPALQQEARWFYTTAQPKGGLLAAMVHPLSSRQVVDAEAADPVVPGGAVDDAEEAPALGAVATLALMGAAFVLRRRST